tara:strand:+ start:7551 stop:8252 length:702 start_codon:yes stop_codon:yes gene_type:complete
MNDTIFFDFYGTLAGFQKSRYELQATACADFNIQVSRKDIEEGYILADLFLSKENSKKPISARTDKEKDQFFSEYEQLILSRSGVEVPLDIAGQIFERVRMEPQDATLYNDVIPILIKLKSLNFKLGIITNLEVDLFPTIQKMNVDKYLTTIVTSREAGVMKPNPQIFSLALERMETNASNSYYVGDNPESDIQGALNVGMSPVLIDRYNYHMDFVLAPRISDLTSLLSLVVK